MGDMVGKKRTKPLKLVTWITLLISAVMLIALCITGIIVAVDTADDVRDQQAEKALNIAQAVSRSPEAAQALQAGGQGGSLREYTKEVQEATNMEYIVVMDMNSVRYTHPREDRIGKRFAGGDETEALNGRTYVSTAEGTLGVSMRAFVPVMAGGEQIGVTSVGILTDSIQEDIWADQKTLVLGSGIGLAAGVLGAFWLARRIKKTMHGLEPLEISQVLEQREAIMSSVREGVLAVNSNGTVILANDAARELFAEAGAEEDPMGKDISHFFADSLLKRVLQTKEQELDQIQQLNDVEIIVSCMPVVSNTTLLGAVATFRNKDELTRLVEQLSGARTYAETLRAQSHEFMNKLHVISAMIQTESYEELDDYVMSISSNYRQEVGWVTAYVKDPVLAGYLMNKISNLQENGIEVELSGSGMWPAMADPEWTDHMITIIGNLIDNARDAMKQTPSPHLFMHIYVENSYLGFQIEDNGRGMDEKTQAELFERGYSTKGEGRGFGMYNTKRSLETLQADVFIDSQPGEGTAFDVQIPIKKEN